MTRWCFVLGLLTSCSFSLGGPDPARPRLQRPTCDLEKNLVVIDALLATTGAVATLALAADHDAVAVVPAVFGAVFLGAAIHGSHVVDACRADNAQYTAALEATPLPDHPAFDDREDSLARPARPVVAAQPTARVAPLTDPGPPAATPMARDPWADFWRVVQ